MRSFMTVALAVIAAASTGALRQASPADVVDELLAADRAFSKNSEQTDLVNGIPAMFAMDVAMVIPGGFARGKEAAAAALKANTENAGARAAWTPIRGGVAADGRHGFTFGYMTIHRTDTTRNRVKYVAYWIKQAEGWRVAVYKRARAAEGTPPTEMMPPSLPAKLVPMSTDAALIRTYRDSLDAAERAFSAEAQKIGLGPAFAKHGHPDAVNVGSPAEPAFVRGPDAIARSVSAGSSPGDPGLSWAPDHVIVASSGDLGVTIGMIRFNAAGPDGKIRAPVPFITIWRRASPQDGWRYIAE